jgi:hypothetical protein
LLKKYDVKILSDCDNIFARNWDKYYCENFIKSDIHNVNHSNIYSSDSLVKTLRMNDVNVCVFNRFQGNLIIVDNEIIKNVGGFPKLPKQYGGEHHNFQTRINRYLKREQYSYDFINTNKYVQNIYLNHSFTTPNNKELMSIENGKMSDVILDKGIIFIDIKDNI